MARLILKTPYYKPSNPGRGGYVSYIATREGVEKLNGRGGMASYIGERRGSNGLFTDEGKDIVLAKIMKEVDEHPGNVWGMILSLRREDAERFGYNSAEQWMNLIRSHRNDVARAMHIDPKNFRWYAAFHQAEGHPHVHIMAWSQVPNEPYLSRRGIEKIKQTFATDIFRQELYSLYSKQTEARDRIREEYRARMEEIVDEADNTPGREDLALRLQDLAVMLNRSKGKKVYGYLSKTQKKKVDEIVRLIASDPLIEEQYDLWYKLQCEKYRTYTDAMPPKLPLEEEKEFRPIRNAVVKAAVMLGSEMQDREPSKNVKAPGKTQGVAQSSGAQSGHRVSSEAIAHAYSLVYYASRIILQSAPQFTEEEDYEDIDRELKREIKMIKNGEPMMMM